MQSIEAILSKTHIQKPHNQGKRVPFSQKKFGAKTFFTLKTLLASSS